MTYGPCGGVTSTHGCEVDDRDCPFVTAGQLVRYEGPEQRRRVALPPDAVIVDFRPDPTMRWEVREAAEVLATLDVIVLVGEHVDDPTPHPPSRVAAELVEDGLATIATLTCRDRTRADLDRELEALAALPLVAVHCVTGDHPAARLGLDRPTTFAVDSIGLVEMAAARDLPVSVAESPSSPMRPWRPLRLLDKQRAGAGLCLLNHAGEAEEVLSFVEFTRTVGVVVPIVAPVPMITDRHSAAALDRFPGLNLAPSVTEAVLGADDPRRAGVEVAAGLAKLLLDSGWIAGVNLSGSGTEGGLVEKAHLVAEIVTEMRSA